MALTLIADQTLKGRIYPAFARHEARPYTQAWRKFGSHWPYTVPLRLQEYCDNHGIRLNVVGLNSSWPADAWYPVGLGFFDFDIDYFDLLPERVKTELFWNDVRVLFYYHEGDNPFRIKERLDYLCARHDLREDCYVFVSANTAARSIPGFVYFTDFELWYWQRNEHTPAEEIHRRPRSRDFTCLSRLHKTWRATVVADLHRQGILANSYWSYCETGEIVDEDNPIQMDEFAQLRHDTQRFLANGPYFCDTMTQDQRNNHSIQESRFYNDAYCNIVLETHFDADQCHGTFLTEKTFKPIKHGQLFFVAGPAGSLDLLRDMGYRVFDNILDNSYDTYVSSTLRWQKLCEAIAAARPHLPKLFEQARADIEHNQQLFQQRKTQRLNTLIKDIHDQRR